MNFLLKGFKELNYRELIGVNGGCSGSCSGSTYSSRGSVSSGYSYSNGITVNPSYSGSSTGCSGSRGTTVVYSGGSYSCSGSTSVNTYSGSSTSCSGSKSTPPSYSGVPVKTGDERMREAINNNMDKATNAYVFGTADCDIWVEKVIQAAGFDIANEWGSAATNTVADHEEILKGKTTDAVSTGWSVVLMTDSDKYSINHCGIINVQSDGSVEFYQSTKSAGGPLAEKYSSVESFKNAYAYKDFDYFKVTA